jgi:hypothetical protein
MSDTTFDPELFMDAEVEGEMETKYTPIPDGDYVAMIDEKLDLKEVNGQPVVDLYHIIDDPELAEKMAMERISVKQSLFLDVADDGSLAFGPNKNVKLGKLREALGQNQAGQIWSIKMLAGAGPLRIKVGSRPDRNDATIIYNDVKATAAL